MKPENTQGGSCERACERARVCFCGSAWTLIPVEKLSFCPVRVCVCMYVCLCVCVSVQAKAPSIQNGSPFI